MNKLRYTICIVLVIALVASPVQAVTYATGGYLSGWTAGTEVSSTYEGRHVELLESGIVHPSHTDGFVDKGDPIVYGNIVGVSFNSASAATDYVAVDTEGIWNLTVVGSNDAGNSAVAIGDPLYINNSTAAISKIEATGTQIPFGYALAAVTGGASTVIAVKVHWDPLPQDEADQYIWVSKNGDDTNGDGTQYRPYASVTAAMAAVTTTRLFILVLPGTYTETTTVTWSTISGVNLIGLGAQYNTIIATSAGDEVISIAPGATPTSTFEVFIENIYIDHDTSGLDGLVIDNTSMTVKINIYLTRFGADGDSADRSILTTHGAAGDAIRIYMEGNNGGIAGDIYYDVGNDGDRFYATGVQLSGGVETSADAIVCALRFISCWGLPENAGLTGGNAAQTILSQDSYSDAPAVINTTDLAGSHTETIIGS